MIRVRVAVVLAALGVFLTACGGSGSSAGAGGGGGGAASPAAPHLDVVKPMAAVLHVQWSATTACDFIDADRKDDQHPTYAPAFAVTGDKTSHMDGDAGMNMTYTYRLRCKVGGAYSAYSNELSANPTVKGP